MTRRAPAKKKHSRSGGDPASHSSNFGVQGADLESRQKARQQAAQAIATGRTPLHVIQSAESAERIAAEALTQAEQQTPRSSPAACVEGCAWCCYQRVGAAVPEVVRIAAYLRQTLSPADLASLLDRLQAAPDRRRSGDRSPCALLVENRCSVYPVRPLTCRGFNSSDAGECEASVRGNGQPVKTIYAPQMRLTTLVLDGLRAGAAQGGLWSETVELIAALRIAFAQPDAVERWLGGAPVFASARLL
jgi:Fe-S-cluster containining protein